MTTMETKCACGAEYGDHSHDDLHCPNPFDDGPLYLMATFRELPEVALHKLKIKDGRPVMESNESGFTSFELTAVLAFIVWSIVVVGITFAAIHFMHKYW